MKQLREYYEPFWERVSPRLNAVHINIGDEGEPITSLCSQDWYMEKGNPPWNFSSIKSLPKVTGPWMVDVKRAGLYRITLRQWPEEAGKPVVAVKAKVEIAGKVMVKTVQAGSKGVVFEIEIPAGETELVTYLYDEKGKAGGAYFTDVEKL